MTVLELVVVLTTISGLLCILMPLLGSIRKDAKKIHCQANIRQLSIGLIAYDAQHRSFPYGFDFQNQLPSPPGGYAGNHSYDRMGWWWFNLIEVDTSQGSILWCPSRNILDQWQKQNVLCGNYGVNQSICKSSRGDACEMVGKPLSSTGVYRPSDTLLVVDAGYSMINWWHATLDSPKEMKGTQRERESYVPGLKTSRSISQQKEFYKDAVIGRHRKKLVNLGYVDGHAASMTSSEFQVQQRESAYNAFPLWRPVNP